MKKTNWTIRIDNNLEVIKATLKAIGILSVNSESDDHNNDGLYPFVGDTSWESGTYNYHMRANKNNFATLEAFLTWYLLEPAKETIELNGKKYYKEELETALKHIKPIE